MVHLRLNHNDNVFIAITKINHELFYLATNCGDNLHVLVSIRDSECQRLTDDQLKQFHDLYEEATAGVSGSAEKWFEFFTPDARVCIGKTCDS